MTLEKITRFSRAVWSMALVVAMGCGGDGAAPKAGDATSAPAESVPAEQKVANDPTPTTAEPVVEKAAAKPDESAEAPPGVILPEPEDAKKPEGPKLP